MKFIKILPLGLAVALSLFGDLSLFAGLVTQLETVHITLVEVGILLSVHRLVRIPGNLLVGSLQDRFGRRRLFVLGMLLAVLSTAAYGLVTGFWPFVLARVAWGAAWALINVSSTTMVLELSRDTDRGSLSGAYWAWIWIGYAVGPLVGGLLTDALTFQRAMLICAALTAVGLAVAFFFVPETRPLPPRRGGRGAIFRGFWRHKSPKTPENPSPPPFAKHPVKGEGGGWGVGGKDLRALFGGGGRLTRVYVIFALVQFACDGVLMATLTLLLTERLGQVIPLGGLQLSPVAAGGIFISGRAALAVLVSLGAGRLSDGIVRRPLLLGLSLAVAAVGMGVLALAQSTGAVLLGLGLNALANGAALAVLPALVRDYTRPEDLGRSLGAYAMVGDIGSSAGPALAFAAAPLLGLGAVYWLCAALFGGSLSLLRTSASGVLKPEGDRT